MDNSSGVKKNGRVLVNYGIVPIQESQEQQHICLSESFFAWRSMEKDPGTVN